MSYPSTISSFTNPNPTDRLNNPSHSSIESAQNAGLTELQTFIGTTNSSMLGTLIYDIRSPQSDGGGHVQSANKGGTGQTTYSKGDILIASSSSVLTKLAIGLDTQVLTANSAMATGIYWATRPVGVSSIKTFNISSVWSKPSVLVGARVTLVGAGGGGGGGAGPGGTGVSGSIGSITSFHTYSVLGGLGGIGGGEALVGKGSFNGLVSGNGGQRDRDWETEYV